MECTGVRANAQLYTTAWWNSQVDAARAKQQHTLAICQFFLRSTCRDRHTLQARIKAKASCRHDVATNCTQFDADKVAPERCHDMEVDNADRHCVSMVLTDSHGGAKMRKYVKKLLPLQVHCNTHQASHVYYVPDNNLGIAAAICASFEMISTPQTLNDCNSNVTVRNKINLHSFSR